MPMQRLTVIESYLDGGTFNEVVCGHGSPRAGSDGSRTRGKQWGMEHKICGKNLVGGLTNSCDYLTRWNNSGKSSASITATQPVCQISAVVKVTKSTRQQAISLCSSTEKYKCIMIAGSDNSHVWTSVLENAAHVSQQSLIQAVANSLSDSACLPCDGWRIIQCHYTGCLAFISISNILCKDCFRTTYSFS